MITFAFVSSLITTTNFAVECCPQAAGAALVVAVGLKNVVAFGLSYGLVPLVNMHGGIYAYSQVLTVSLKLLYLPSFPYLLIACRAH